MTLNEEAKASENGNQDPQSQTTAEGVNPLALPVVVFQGYDSVDGRGLSTGVEGTTKSLGGDSTVRYDVCLDIEAICQSLGIDWSLAAGFGPIATISRKNEFVRTLKTTTFSLSIVVYSKHTVNTETSTDVRLKTSISPPKGDDNASLTKFFYAYGDSFVSSVTTGGEYYAVYTFYAQTKEEQTGLVRQMQAEGIYEGVSLGAALQTKLNKFVGSCKVRISFNQGIAGLQNPQFPPAEEMITFAQAFTSKPIDAAAIIGFDTTGYERVPQIGTAFNRVADNRRYFVGERAVGGLTAKLVQAQQLDDQLTWLRDTYYAYGGYTDPKVNSVKSLTTQDLSTINAQMTAYTKDPTQSFAPPPLPSLNEGTPSLRATVGTSPFYGNSGGSPFDDVPDYMSYLQTRTRITALQLRTGSRVDKLIVTSMSDGGTNVVQHGGGGGSLGNPLTVQPRQFITRITGRYDNRIDKLAIHVTDGATVSGGGGGGKVSFDFPVPPNTFGLGFRGRSNTELDGIQLVYASFNPAEWRPR